MKKISLELGTGKNFWGDRVIEGNVFFFVGKEAK